MKTENHPCSLPVTDGDPILSNRPYARVWKENPENRSPWVTSNRAAGVPTGWHPRALPRLLAGGRKLLSRCR